MNLGNFRTALDYQSLQSAYMNIPVKAYISYIYPKLGYDNDEVDAVLGFLMDMTDCSENYVHYSFNDPKPDESITIGQLLRIATLMIGEEGSLYYSGYPDDKLCRTAHMILALLIIIPFKKLAARKECYYSTDEIEEHRQLLRNLKPSERN